MLEPVLPDAAHLALAGEEVSWFDGIMARVTFGQDDRGTFLLREGYQANDFISTGHYEAALAACQKALHNRTKELIPLVKSVDATGTQKVSAWHCEP